MLVEDLKTAQFIDPFTSPFVRGSMRLLKSLMVSSGENADCCVTCERHYEQFFVFLAAAGKIKSISGEVRAVIGESRRLSCMLNRRREFLHIVLIGTDSLGSMTNISDEGIFKRMQLHSQITSMQHQQRRSGVPVQLILTNRQLNLNYYNCWIHQIASVIRIVFQSTPELLQSSSLLIGVSL